MELALRKFRVLLSLALFISVNKLYSPRSDSITSNMIRFTESCVMIGPWGRERHKSADCCGWESLQLVLSFESTPASLIQSIHFQRKTEWTLCSFALLEPNLQRQSSLPIS